MRNDNQYSAIIGEAREHTGLPDKAVTPGHPHDRPLRSHSIRPARSQNVRKIPPHLRRQKIDLFAEPGWWGRFFWRLKEDSQFQRSAVQLTFLFLCIWIGIEFYFFMQWGLSGVREAFFPRPPGVEGFLPISALISLKYWLQTGIINKIHPSGLFIFIAIIATSLFLKKAFCSWMCPIGTLSESLWKLGEKLFGHTVRIPRWLDFPLRSLKYLLLLFFVWSIWNMNVPDLAAFIYSPYNKVADIKMYLFFADISEFALWTIIILVALSLVIKNFWCRFLCPYGALLGIVSWLSPLKITRNRMTCIDCELCTKACPANIKVHSVRRVWSDECTSCLECVQSCPVRDTLDLRVHASRNAAPTWVFGCIVVGVFVAITGAAVLTGNWYNDISREEYQRRFQHLDSPLYQHFRGNVPYYGPND